MEPQSGAESDEPMYLHIAGPRPEGVAHAKKLVDELLEKVKTDYQAFKDRPPHSRFGDRDGGYGNGRPSYGDRGDRDRSHSHSYGYGGGQGGYGGQNAYGGHNDVISPTVAVAPADQNAQAVAYNEQMAQWAAYYAQNPAEDPYAQYGGFAANMALYQQSLQGSYYGGQAYGQTQSPAPGAGGAVPPPPAEPSSGYGVPPPPPPPAASPPGYAAVRTF
jgi:hypothetical protein